MIKRKFAINLAILGYVIYRGITRKLRELFTDRKTTPKPITFGYQNAPMVKLRVEYL